MPKRQHDPESLWLRVQNTWIVTHLCWAWWAVRCWVWGHGTGVEQFTVGSDKGKWFCVRCLRKFKNKPRRCHDAKL